MGAQFAQSTTTSIKCSLFSCQMCCMCDIIGLKLNFPQAVAAIAAAVATDRPEAATTRYYCVHHVKHFLENMMYVRSTKRRSRAGLGDPR